MVRIAGPRHRTVVTTVVVLIVGLILLGIFAAWVRVQGFEFPGHAGVIRLFNLDSEFNLPTIISVLGLASCGAMLGIVGRIARANGNRDALRLSWLGLLFVLLAVDEGSQLHERLNPPMNAVLSRLGIEGGALRFGWVVAGMLFVALLVPIYLPMLRRLPGDIERLMWFAAFAYVGGAIGMELLGARIYDPEAASYLTLTIFEEGLEMTGIGLFFIALHRLAMRWAPTLHVELVGADPR